MENYYENQGGYQQYEQQYPQSAPYSTGLEQTTAFAQLMTKVYVWMTLALAVTGLTAYGVAHSPSMIYAIFGNQILIWGLIIAELALVIGLSAAINKISFTTAALLFVLYSVINGVTLSVIFLAYTESSIAKTFFVTAGAFAGMAFVGYTTKKDLSAMGKFLLFALIGLIIASIVNIFMKSSGFDFVISIIGILIFAGLTAYDSQKIKKMFLAYGYEVNDETQKLAVLGSLTLYLDFINLFLYLLRFMGRRN